MDDITFHEDHLYRYLPVSWDLLGHTWAENLLKKHILRDEVRHAYLFCGAPGIGRRSLALEFAAAVNCMSPASPGEPCGECRVCRQTAAMQQVDLSIISPEGEGGVIKVDQIRALQHTLSLTPYEARYRIALLTDFQFANANAQNALLKTLEEAPRQVILMLTADAAERLLPTIASRCEILRLRPVPVAVLEEALRTRWDLPAEQARLYASLSNGRTALALQMAGDPETLKKRKDWADRFFDLLPHNRRSRMRVSETIARQRDQLRMTLQVWLSLARDVLLVSHGAASRLTNVDYETDILTLSQSLGSARALAMVNSLTSALDDLEANANLRLLSDVTLLNIPRVL